MLLQELVFTTQMLVFTGESVRNRAQPTPTYITVYSIRTGQDTLEPHHTVPYNIRTPTRAGLYMRRTCAAVDAAQRRLHPAAPGGGAGSTTVTLFERLQNLNGRYRGRIRLQNVYEHVYLDSLSSYLAFEHGSRIPLSTVYNYAAMSDVTTA